MWWFQGKSTRIVQNQGTHGVAPGHLGIAEMRQVTLDPDQLAVVGVAGDVRIAEGDVDGILGDGGRVDGQVRLFVGALVHAEAEVMPPQFLAVLSVEAERQQGFLALSDAT